MAGLRNGKGTMRAIYIGRLDAEGGERFQIIKGFEDFLLFMLL